MSNGKKLIALALATFIALIVVGAVWSGKGGDTTGAHTGTAADVIASQGLTGDTVPPSQVGINAVANEVGHVRVAVNFSWLLMTGYLVLFMQVGFAFLVTGLTRAKNAAHMMMMNVAAFAIALIAYYAVGFAFHFGGVGAIANLGGTSPLNGLFPHGNSGLIGWHGFFLQSGHGYDVGVIGLFLFQVVFMETAGYIIIGAIAERISFAGFIVAELAMGAIIYPIYGNWVWGGGWMAHLGQTLHWGHGAVDFAGSGVVHATGGWAALALAMVLGPRIGKFNSDGSPNAFPGHNIGYVVIGTMIVALRVDGVQPRLDVRRDRPPHLDRRGQHAALRVLRLPHRDVLHERALRQARHLDVVQRHARRPRRDHGAVCVRRTVGGVDHRHRRRVARLLGRLVLRSCRARRRPVRRDLGPRHQRRMGRARSRDLRRRHLRVGMERGQRGREGPALRRPGPVHGAGRSRRGRVHLGLGHHVPHLLGRRRSSSQCGCRPRSSCKVSTCPSSGRSATRTSSSCRTPDHVSDAMHSGHHSRSDSSTTPAGGGAGGGA